MISNNSNIILPGTWINIQNNTRRFKIVRVAGWSSIDPKSPSHYDVVNSSGNHHAMIPVERISVCPSFYDSGVTSHRIVIYDTNSDKFSKNTHCWSCKKNINSDKNDFCAKCRGLICSCGSCLCNKSYY